MWPFKSEQKEERFKPDLPELSGTYDESTVISPASWVQVIKNPKWRPG